MKTMSILIALMLISPNLWAADYSAEGRVDLSTAGADVPGFSAQEVGIMGAAAGIFTVMGFFDWPLGKGPSYAAGAASVLLIGAARKEAWDGSAYDDDHALEVPSMEVESGTVWELL